MRGLREISRALKIESARVVKWQTRTFEGRMPKGMRVQVPPRAPSSRNRGTTLMKAERCIPSRSFGQRRALFDRVFVINDFEPHPAAMNMAIDEALLESADVSSIRFYHWNSP